MAIPASKVSESWLTHLIPRNQTPAFEFEEIMNRAGLGEAFIDLRNPASGGEWLREVFISRPLHNWALEASWHDMLDGFVYLDQSDTSEYRYFSQGKKKEISLSSKLCPQKTAPI